MITERDRQIIDHLKKEPLDTKQINELYFPGKTMDWTRIRLRTLESRGHIKSRKGPDDKFTIFFV